MNKQQKSFSRTKLLRWIGEDAFREESLISLVPVKASTLAKIKSGSYEPSVRLGNAINNVIKRGAR